MATKEELFKTNPPKGTKAWSEKEDAQQAQKGTQQYVDGTAVVNTLQQKKEDEKKNIVDNTKKNPQLATNVQRKRYQPNYYQHVKDDLIDITEKKEEKKEETKQQSETPVKQQDNTIDPKEVKKELNELVYGVPLYHNDSPVGYKKTDAPAQQQQNVEKQQSETPAQQQHHRPSIKTKGLPTDEELLQYAPESEISSNTTKKEEKKEVTKEANYDVPEQEFDPMGYKRGNKQIQVDVPSKPVSTPTPAKEEVTKEETVKTPSEEEVKQSEVESETQSKPADNTADGKKSLSYVEMYEQLNPKPDPEQIKKQLKRQRTRNIISAIGDGVSALSNLHFTSKGAPNMYDGKNTLTEKSQARYDKLMKGYKDDLEAWRQGRMKAEQLDKEWNHRADREKVTDDQWRQSFEHTKSQAEVTNKFNQDKFDYEKTKNSEVHELNKEKHEEDKRQFDENMQLQWAKLNTEKDKNAADTAYKTYIMNGGKNSDKNKRTVLSAEGGNDVSIHTGVWENAVPQLFNIMMEEGIDPYPNLSGTMKANALKEMTPEEIENFVKGQWQKSPRAVALIQHMSELDPYNMENASGSFDKQLGNFTIPYQQWKEEIDNIFNKMMDDGGYGVYNENDAELFKASKINNLSTAEKEKIITDHWQESPQAKDYIYKISRSSIDDDNTMPGVSNSNSDNTMPGVKK